MERVGASRTPHGVRKGTDRTRIKAQAHDVNVKTDKAIGANKEC